MEPPLIEYCQSTSLRKILITFSTPFPLREEFFQWSFWITPISQSNKTCFLPGQDAQDPVWEWDWWHRELHVELVDFCGRMIPEPASDKPGSQYSPFQIERHPFLSNPLSRLVSSLQRKQEGIKLLTSSMLRDGHQHFWEIPYEILTFIFLHLYFI